MIDRSQAEALTDIEIVRLCAEAMNIRVYTWAKDTPNQCWVTIGNERTYDPLHNDEQMVALIKRFRLDVWWPFNGDKWQCAEGGKRPIENADLNRAVCECVAMMQRSKR